MIRSARSGPTGDFYCRPVRTRQSEDGNVACLSGLSGLPNYRHVLGLYLPSARTRQRLPALVGEGDRAVAFYYCGVRL